MIYLDNAATTRPCAEAVAAVNDALTARWGNPSAVHRLGIEAARLLRTARQDVAEAMGAETERVFFTSGGTEADNWAIFSAAERLGKLARHTGRILEEIGRELAAGNIAADPFWRGPDHNACQWCEYAAACHFEEGRGGDRRRFLPAVRSEEFWQAVAKEQV